MKRFLEMIEQVKRQTHITAIINNKVQHEQLRKTGKTFPEVFKTDMFFHFVEHCQPFVFSPKNSTPEEIDGLEVLYKENVENYIEPTIDAPFKVWSAEIAGDNYITVPRGDDGMPLVSVIAFMAVEQEPGDFMYFMYVEYPDGKGYQHGNNMQREVMITCDLGEVAAALIKRLYSEKTGIEPGRMKVKLGTGKQKKFIKIPRVIHVRPKKLVSISTRSETGREIDWSHRWTVRGCWVDLGQDRIGKDRDGNYCVQGKTWRVEHIKGPENMPLIKKTRVVQDEKPKGD